MAGDKTYITDSNGKLHRATRTHKVTPESIVWSSNPNDYAVQVRIDGKWHRAFLTMDAGTATYFDNINIDKALVTGGDGKTHTCLICSPEATVTMSSIKTDQHSLVAGTTTGETAVNVYSENWSNVQWQDNVNVYKVLVTGSDGKVHTALLTTSVGGGVEVIIKGTSPLVLPDAVANSLSYVKAFGGTMQGLPDGYTLLNGVTNGSSTYVDTGIMPIVDDVEIEIRAKPTTGSWYILQSRESGSTIWGISGSSSGSTILLGWAGISSLCQSAITRDPTHTYYVKATLNNGTATLYVKDETANTEDTQTNTYTSAVPPLPFWLYGNQKGDRVDSGNTVYMARIKVGGVTVMDYVPALNSSNVVGFYDKATGDFKVSSAGTLTADQTIVPTPTAPMDIVSNNGVLKFAHNIYDQATMGTNKGVCLYIQDKVYIEPNSNAGFIIPIKPNTKYTIDPHNSGVSIFRVGTADKEIDATYTSDNPYSVNNYVKTTSSDPITVTSSATDHYLYIQVNYALFSQVAPTLTITEHSVYADGTVETIKDSLNNTATAEILLKAGDYQDVQSILDGVVTRKVGVKVLDGTESWSPYQGGTCWTSANLFPDKVSGNAQSYCTHYSWTSSSVSNMQDTQFLLGGSARICIKDDRFQTDTELKTFLAAQYAAGTPVIVVYPLAESTTETVTGQTLQVTNGDNTLEITQASLTGLELEVQYTASVALTVQEVEDANLDNNVTVTII